MDDDTFLKVVKAKLSYAQEALRETDDRLGQATVEYQKLVGYIEA